MRLTLSSKGVVLLAVPTAAQLFLAGMVFWTQRAHVGAEQWAAHSKEVLSQTHVVLADAEAVVAATRLYAAAGAGSGVPAESAGNDLRADLDRLEFLVSDNPGQSEHVRAAQSAADALVARRDAVVRAAGDGNGDRAVRLAAAAGSTADLAQVRSVLVTFAREEERLDRDRAEGLKAAGRWVDRVLVGGAAVSFLLTAGVWVVFHRGISRRFAALVNNTRRLAAGQPLAAPLSGTDEIADLDRAFRATAAELTRAADRLRESADQIQDLYDHAPCGYHSVDPDGTIVAMNQTELRWLGRPADQVMGRSKFVDAVSPASRETYWATFARMVETGAASDVELEVLRADGTTFPVLLNSTAVRDPDGRFVRSRSILTDLTERKRAEDEVRRLNTDLEVRVRDRTADLAEANRTLAARNEENELFVYSVSHDLRSPLVNLQGFSQELRLTFGDLRDVLTAPDVPAGVRDRAAGLLDRDADESLRFILAGVMRLSGIIDALLRLSRVGRVEYQCRWVDVGAAVGRIVGSLHKTVADKGAEVAVGPLPPAWGDATAVEQVFANLIGNALNYLDPVRPGRIEVGVVPSPGGRTGSRTSSGTTAWASRRRTSTRSSRRSSGSTRTSRPARGWAWRSSAGSPTATAGGSGSSPRRGPGVRFS
ncbi:Phytochrome, two-component sensor histidine kinase [Fimbriiglobus ruber]|uniref:histidine kinase n=1 Tax=Fimbriiglobus ruber TaxID=1908690 RepID=A0A225E0G6_9BACT|nr:PAS domain-containing protein [Fimbriiglobus ruber]OWK42989.1 Phytochrome, two-component sensor histidine kinase [Fimbriiglobus ruber]